MNGGTHDFDLDLTPIQAGNRTTRVEVIANTVEGDDQALDSYFINVNGIGVGQDF